DSGTTASLLAFGSRDSFEQIGRGIGLTLSEKDQDIVFHRVQLQIDKRLGEGLSLVVSPSLGYDSSRAGTVDSIGLSDLNRHDTRSLTAGLRSELVWKPSSTLEVRAGTDFS